MTTAYLESLLDAKAHLEAEGARVAVFAPRNESLITRARDACVARFLAARVDEEAFTHLMFIDADIGFPREAIARLIRFGEPVVAGCYPKKELDYALIAELVRAGHPTAEAPELLEAAACDYPMAAPPIREIRDGFVEVHETGAGFLLVRRDAIERMIAAAPERAYRNDVPGYSVAARDHLLGAPLEPYALFTTGIDEHGRYVSEDYAFLRRWRALGGKVWLDIALPLAHVGAHEWRGHVGYFLERLGVVQRNQR